MCHGCIILILSLTAGKFPVVPTTRRLILTSDTQSGAPGASTNLTALSGGAKGSTGGDNPLSSDALLALVLDTLEDAKASDVVPIDLIGKTPIADHMVIASGTSTRQVVTMSEKVVEKLKREGHVVPRLEGVSQGDWALIDAGDVIVHIFRPEVREFYNLERMWTGAGEPASDGSHLNG